MFEPAAGHLRPIGLPGVAAEPVTDPRDARTALRTVLDAVSFARGGPPPAGLAVAYPDRWSREQIETLAQAAATLGYSANLVRLMTNSMASTHGAPAHPGEDPAAVAARGVLLAAIGPAPATQPAPPQAPERQTPTPEPPIPEPADQKALRPEAPRPEPPDRKATGPEALEHEEAPEQQAAEREEHEPETPGQHLHRKPTTHARTALTARHRKPGVRRPNWISVAFVATVAVLAVGVTVAVLVGGDEDPASAATSRAAFPASATTPNRGTPLVPATTAPPAITSPRTVPPPAAATLSPAPPPPAAVSPAPNPTPNPPAPAPPKPTTQPPTSKDSGNPLIAGACQGLLDQVSRFPGGLPAMRSQIAKPAYLSPADWDEVFSRAAAGSCG
ncbi:hypothetical protein D7D52_02750 [Nocardia yunnanensis]|uniref:Uncharacterized protein n=1 Tax=Nocardia yunnanensis TaxID=2382165 RepID=A0A386Z6T4_9NOCA|nr:hypothetical protein [Nocardia yunnanensis]AYF72963.1 hypothetical protein D7D52_02750 [Nocardia yunnanensis]